MGYFFQELQKRVNAMAMDNPLVRRSTSTFKQTTWGVTGKKHPYIKIYLLHIYNIKNVPRAIKIYAASHLPSHVLYTKILCYHYVHIKYYVIQIFQNHPYFLKKNKQGFAQQWLWYWSSYHEHSPAHMWWVNFCLHLKYNCWCSDWPATHRGSENIHFDMGFCTLATDNEVLGYLSCYAI